MIARFADSSCLGFRYAGWLGTIAARYKEGDKLSEYVPNLDESRHRLAACAGTSTCHIVQVSTEPLNTIPVCCNTEKAVSVNMMSFCAVINLLPRNRVPRACS